jgi:hypothetical protein
MSSNRKNSSSEKPSNLTDCKDLLFFAKAYSKEQCRKTPVSGSTSSSFNRLNQVNDIQGSVDSRYVHRQRSYPYNDHADECAAASDLVADLAKHCMDLVNSKLKM